MNPLLEQFISESREALQGISQKLMQLENEPDSGELMTELFRFVHTLKGNSGLFDFPELTRVLHAGEDLMDAVREGKVAYSQRITDSLLDAMDFVGMLCDEIEKNDGYDAAYAGDSLRLAEALRQLIGTTTSAVEAIASPVREAATAELSLLSGIPEQVRMDAYRASMQGASLHFLAYSPVEECFFQGDDPFFQARRTPGLLWGGISARKPWPKLIELDAYSCVLDFHVLSAVPAEELALYYRYVSEQLTMTAVPPHSLILPQGDPNGGPVYDDFVDDALRLLGADDVEGLIRAARSMLEFSNRELWLASALRWLLLAAEMEPENHAVLQAIIASLNTLTPPDWRAVETDPLSVPAAVEIGNGARPARPAGKAEPLQPQVRAAAEAIVAAQREILSLPGDVGGIGGRLRGVALALEGCLRGAGLLDALSGLQAASQAAVGGLSALPLLSFIDSCSWFSVADDQSESEPLVPCRPELAPLPQESEAPELPLPVSASPADGETKFGRRSEDAFAAAKSIKVDQAKIDLLMNLIGEMVVAKNALPYLAGRAESAFGVPELSREIKAQYAVINRIAEEMQDSIMQVRMMPVSFVFQRFPRLVRDTSNKLGKEVNLVLEGEDTEADKNIIESLGDPLVHIVRNSLDHGIESPATRVAAGKPAAGTLIIRASQESDRVVIEIRDDGKGIDPEVIKRKAYEKGVIDEERLERISDQEAVNLVFASGFSTAETVSDLSGRGVGMDVVKTAIEKVNGSVQLESEKGRGTRIRITLPLSMAVTNVMIVESNAQIFGVPMDAVVETVRVPRSAIKLIKRSMATVLRGRIVPLKSLNTLLGLSAQQKANDEGELAVLVVNVGGQALGVLVDDFHETVDIILKPMTGILAGMPAYAGSALLGDGSVLMVLDIKEVV